MSITQDVITDLLPLYFSGEASADSRAVVDAYFRAHPEFERVARKSVRVEIPVVPGPETVVEKQSLQRVRRILRIRSLLLGAALFCTLAPFSVLSRDGDISWLVLRNPEVAAALGVAAGFLWGAYFRTHHMLRDSR
jgi:hypothetical protein